MQVPIDDLMMRCGCNFLTEGSLLKPHRATKRAPGSTTGTLKFTVVSIEYYDSTASTIGHSSVHLTSVPGHETSAGQIGFSIDQSR